MYIKVVDSKYQVKYHIEASYIKWDRNTIAIYPIITKSKQAGVVSKSATEVANMPSIYVHVEHGDTIYVMNNEGKTIDSKRIVIGAEAERGSQIDEASCTHCGWAMGEREGKPACSKCGPENEWACPRCSHRNPASEGTCTGRHSIQGSENFATCGFARPGSDTQGTEQK